MHFTEFFIRRTITTTLLMLAVCIFGVLAYFGLPVSDLPAIDFPTISVSVNQPGASPETMANTVATPLEREFTSLQGISSINSSSTIGSTRITLQFDLARNIDARGAGRPVRYLRSQPRSAPELAASAYVPQGESRGLAHPLHRLEFDPLFRYPKSMSTPRSTSRSAYLR